MDVTMPLENIYNMLSSLSVGNKKWLADHLYADIKQSQDARTKEQLALDMETSLLEAKAFKDGEKVLKSVDALIDELQNSCFFRFLTLCQEVDETLSVISG